MTRADITTQDKLNELRLDFSNPQSFGKIFILLEGESDVRLYRRLYAHERVKIETVPGGKPQLKEGLRLSSSSVHLLGICDADFAHLNGESPELENLFFTDFHDIEMQMVATEATFRAIMYEFTALEPQEQTATKEALLTLLRPVSYLRWYNELAGLLINFKEMPLGKLFDPTTLEVNLSDYCQLGIRRSSQPRTTDIAQILLGAEALHDLTHDNYQLCNGHDFLTILALYFTHQNPKKSVAEERIASQFRTSYTFGEFATSRLHQQVVAWLAGRGIELTFS
jgi:hypothetical protein